MSLFLGVDVGLRGAMVFVHDDGYAMQPMPIVADGKNRNQYDIGLIHHRLVTGRPVLAVIEKQQVLPAEMGGGNANYARGRGLGIFEALFVALEIPYEIVAPKTWQRIYHRDIGGDDLKAKSVIAAQRLFPGVDLKRTARCRKLDDGIAEALLLAHYARARVTQGAK